MILVETETTCSAARTVNMSTNQEYPGYMEGIWLKAVVLVGEATIPVFLVFNSVSLTSEFDCSTIHVRQLLTWVSTSI